ncbi:AAA domain-containing protein [Pseudomonas poae]|uniref:AAA domain-containing protein n=1 Tax=Pseudomonas poae TaxID=200451 RepID=A0A7Z1GRB0_9PSED|nr:AAA-like domain-containing protein [Pseudomonas poae]PFG60744.1 AAA domain-containing protein [Pseudomonas poae]
MTRKVLRRSTIIPIDLYIERAADRQLKSIVDEMGRPGYVLVARQMGKTNLLIHMKRTRTDDLVLYKDLSAQFDTSRTFFRDIIDSLIESFEELQPYEELIVSQRNDKIEANVEYDRHLRVLLKHTDKRIIIVLDEIDSLVNAPFSDVIFAQIRSMYFSRINFPEYERLTYVLSGVAEPTDLIKNKNISPFNIGEKIYLEDFGFSEFEAFIYKSKIDVSEEVISSIYDWTSGNPRMTWDICTEIEDMLIADQMVDSKTVAEVVNKLYLRDFDRAPVDHIRILVDSDKIIRDAIASIRWGKSEFVDDKTKSRLYLSGITGSAGGEVKIKNRIIDEALSDSWLKSITPTATSPIILALSYYALGDHPSVISAFEEIKADRALASKLTINNRLNFATSYLWMKKTELALDEFKYCLSISTGNANRQESELRIGNTLFYFKEHECAVEFFEAASNGPSSILKYNAQLQLAECYRASGLENNPKTLEIIEDLLLTLDTPDIHASEAGRTLYVASTVLRSNILMDIGRYEEADISLGKAFPMAVFTAQPKLLLLRYECVRNDALQRQDILVQLCNIVMSNSLVTRMFDEADLHFDNKQVAQVLSCLLEQNMLELFEEFLDYISSKSFAPNICRTEIIMTCVASIPSLGERASQVGLLLYAATNYLDDDVPLKVKLKLYRQISSYTDLPNSTMWRIRYLDEISKHTEFDHITVDDIQALSFTAFQLRKEKQFEKLEGLYNFWKKISTSAIELTPYWSIFVIAHAMLFKREIKCLPEARENAQQALDLIQLHHKDIFANSRSEEFHAVKRHADEILRLRAEHDPFRHIGRNQKIQVSYGEDKVVVVKFKQVREDLIGGKCVLINELI